MTRIYYFSGTGNTLWAAKRLAVLLGTGVEVYSIGSLMGSAPAAIEAERVIIMYPAYAYGAPAMVRRFLETRRIRASYIGALVTYGTGSGGALGEVYSVLRKQGLRLSFAGRIPSVENFIPIFGPPSKKSIAKRLAAQESATERAAQEILEGKIVRPWTIRPVSQGISRLFKIGKRFFPKYYRVTGVCNGCGSCEKVCPAKAITLEQGRPVFSGACEHCQACLNWCPRRAIQYLRLKPDTPRYHHPEVALRDMLRDGK